MIGDLISDVVPLAMPLSVSASWIVCLSLDEAKVICKRLLHGTLVSPQLSPIGLPRATNRVEPNVPY